MSKCKKITPLKDNRVTIRLSDTQVKVIDSVADTFSVSRSEVLRMIIDKYIANMRG